MAARYPRTHAPASGPGRPTTSRRAVLAGVASGVLGATSARRTRAHTEVIETVPTLDPPAYYGDGVDASPDVPFGAEELVVHCGGYGTNDVTWDPVWQAGQMASALAADADYETTVVAYDYDLFGTYYAAKWAARGLGAALASWLDDYAAAYPGTTVRLLGHSLGAQVVVNCLEALGGTVASAGSLLGGVATTAVTAGGEYADGVASSCLAFHSYYDRTDLVAPGWSMVEFERPIATHPAEGVEPATYEDVDVTGLVRDHLSAFLPGEGCMDVVAAAWRAGPHCDDVGR